jgi:hypothetical protein
MRQNYYFKGIFMKEFKEADLQVWTDGGNIGDKIYFTVIKTPSCVKCKLLQNNAEKAFGSFVDNVAWYEYKPGETVAAKIFTDLGITSAPVIVFRFQERLKRGNFYKDVWSLAAIGESCQDSDFVELRCLIDAAIENDQSFIGFDEFDEQIDKDGEREEFNKKLNRLFRLIHGELDPIKLKERKSLKDNNK